MTALRCARAAIGRAFAWSTDFVCSHDGKPSNPKLMGWAVYTAFVTGHPLPVVVVGMLLAAAFGMKTFQMWLQRGTWSASSADVAITRRDPAAGVDPA